MEVSIEISGIKEAKRAIMAHAERVREAHNVRDVARLSRRKRIRG